MKPHVRENVDSDRKLDGRNKENENGNAVQREGRSHKRNNDKTKPNKSTLK